jgi:hypothetical protein
MQELELIKNGMSTPVDQKRAKFAVGAVFTIATLTVLYFTLPWLVPIFNNIQQIADSLLRIGIEVLIGGAVLLFLKAQWRNIGYLNEAIARRVFAGIVEYDPFIIQEKQLTQKEIDIENMMQNKAIIEGKYKLNIDKLKKRIKEKDEAEALIKDLSNKIKYETNDRNKKMLNDDLYNQTIRLTACQNYIDTITPLVNNMEFIIQCASDGYIYLKNRIKALKEQLNINKDTYETAVASSGALSSFKKAVVGDIQLNSDAEKAQVLVMQKTAYLIGQVNVSMEIISNVIREDNINDAGKILVARNQLEQLNLKEGQALPIPTISTDFGNKQPIQNLRYTLPD